MSGSAAVNLEKGSSIGIVGSTMHPNQMASNCIQATDYRHPTSL